MGGTDNKSNIIRLTIEEHAEAHRQLWLQHGKIQDKLAWLMLSGKKSEAEQARIELLRTPEYRATMSEAMKGLVRTKQHRMNISKSLIGKRASEETRHKQSLAKIGTKFHLGHKHSEESRAKMRAAWERRRQQND